MHKRKEFYSLEGARSSVVTDLKYTSTAQRHDHKETLKGRINKQLRTNGKRKRKKKRNQLEANDLRKTGVEFDVI